MALFDHMLKCEHAPLAKTQIIDVKGDLKDNLCRLLSREEHGLSVVYGFRDGKRDRKKEPWEAYAKRMHGEIKGIIRNNLGLNKNDHVTYETVRTYVGFEDRWFFFYLSEENVDSADLIYSLEKNGLSIRRVFQATMSLHLKRFFVADTQTLYPLLPTHYNSELYVNASKVEGSKKSVHYINALRPELYFGDKHDLCLSIKRITFQAEHTDGFLAQTDETSLYFQGSSKEQSSYKVLKRVDARKRQTPYMSFGSEYKFCVNYTEHLMMEVLMAVLTTYEVPFTQRFFQANYVSDYFLELERERNLPLIIIDDSGESEDDSLHGREETFHQLKETLTPEAIVKSSELPEFNMLRPDRAYLVINRAPKNGSSIRNFTEEQRHKEKVENAISKAEALGEKPKLPKPKIYTTFWQALEEYDRNPDSHFDYYTKMKLAAFEKGNTLVLQGLNIDRFEIEKKQEKTNKKTGIVKTDIIPPLNISKLLKIETELWLKEQVRIHRELQETNLPNGEFRLYKIRNTRWSKFLAYAVNVSIKNGNLKINNVERFTEEQRLRAMHECLDEDIVPKLYDGAFYLFDVKNETMLSDYNTIRVPRIIGSLNVDSVETGLNSDKGPGRAATNTVLPYYVARVMRKQYHHIHMQHSGKDLVYFVSPTNKPNAKLSKQNLTYNIRVTDMNGEILDPLETPITAVFLQSFTRNIHKVNEVSKSSILEKIVDSYLSN